MMGFGMFGWLFGVLFMVMFLGLGVLVVIWMARAIVPGFLADTSRGNVNATAQGITCPTCGRAMQVNWTVCPYDGTVLGG